MRNALKGIKKQSSDVEKECHWDGMDKWNFSIKVLEEAGDRSWKDKHSRRECGSEEW